MEYEISKNEISRRKKAYITLSISLIIGLFLSSIIFDFPASFINYFLTVGAMFMIGFFSFRFFHYLSKTKISIPGKSLIRVNDRIREEYSLTRVNRVKVKWTTRDAIREIYIWFTDRKSVFITGLDNFGQFRKDLLSKISKDVAVKEVHEFLDFDHPLFYSVLGLVVSGIGVLFMKLIASFNFQNMQILLSALFIYMFILGIYFIIARPISKRLGNQRKIIDYVFGLIMVFLGIYICSLGLV
jgi:hypothetical protein